MIPLHEVDAVSSLVMRSTISGNTNVPLDNMTLAYKERCVVDSAGFLRREQDFRETEAFIANCDEVFVWEYVGLIIV